MQTKRINLPVLAAPAVHSGLLAVRADGTAAERAELAAGLRRWQAEFNEFREAKDAEIAALRNDLTDMEQRVADGSIAGASAARRTPGAVLAETLTKDATFQQVAEGRIKEAGVGVSGMAMLGIQANTIRYDSGGLDVADHRGEIVTGMQRRRWLRDRLVPITTAGGSVEYTRELAFTNNATEQGGGSPFEHEGVAKSESAITFEQVDEKVPTIAHFVKASKQILADVPMLRNTLDTRLLYGLELRLEQQILNGTGVGAQMAGLTASGNFTAFTPTSGDTAIDSVNRALAALEANEAVPDVVILHPTDFRAMQRVKASGSGEYLFGAPSGQNTASVWNTDIHVTSAMTAGKFLAMDSVQMGVLFLREDAKVDVGYVNDDFTKNLVVLLAELRAVIAVQRPAAVQYGSLTL